MESSLPWPRGAAPPSGSGPESEWRWIEERSEEGQERATEAEEVVDC